MLEPSQPFSVCRSQLAASVAADRTASSAPAPQPVATPGTAAGADNGRVYISAAALNDRPAGTTPLNQDWAVHAWARPINHSAWLVAPRCGGVTRQAERARRHRGHPLCAAPRALIVPNQRRAEWKTSRALGHGAGAPFSAPARRFCRRGGGSAKQEAARRASLSPRAVASPGGASWNSRDGLVMDAKNRHPPFVTRSSRLEKHQCWRQARS